MTPEEKAVVDAATAWYEDVPNALTRTEWALVQAIEALPGAKVTPIYS